MSGVVLSKILSDLVIFKLYEALFHYSVNLFLWMLVQWTSKMCPFHISKNNFWWQIHFKEELHNRFNLISEERVKISKHNSENLMKIGLKNKEVMTLWSFANFHKTFLDQSIWICKWVSWWCHHLTTCHIFCTYKFKKFNILPKLVIVCPSYQDILELTLFCIYSERN